MVVDACRIHLRGCCGDSLDKLEGPNYKVIIDDCLKRLDEYSEIGRKFDVIINDLTDIPIATSPQGEWYTSFSLFTLYFSKEKKKLILVI
ncbi:UNVERIFIED_CONTAM: Spermine synthase [Trichonephila clavipes]